MRTLHNFIIAVAAITMLGWSAVTVFAADPGIPIPDNSELNDQKTGSVLFFNIFSSSATNPNAENTRINITNTNPSLSTAIRLIFVGGDSPATTGLSLALTQNHTISFLASDIDPGVRGYLVVVAVSWVTGCPVNFNYLSGDEYVKLDTGHTANLAAEAISALYPETLPGCDSNSVTATLNFDGVSYNRLPRTLAIDKVRSPDDNNSTLLILNRIGGSMGAGGGRPSEIGQVSGEIIDDLANSYGFNFTSNMSQLTQMLSSTFPKNSPPLFNTIVPAGHTGWMTLSGVDDVGLLGSVINFNSQVTTSESAYRGGRNLRKLTLSATNSITIPVTAPQ